MLPNATVAADGRHIQVWIGAGDSRTHTRLAYVPGAWRDRTINRWYLPLASAPQLLEAIPGLKISDSLWAALEPETRNAVRLQREAM